MSRHRLQHSQPRLTSTLRRRSLGRSQVPVEMRLDRRMPRAQRALLFRLSSAPRATHRQYASQRQFLGLHNNIIQHREWDRWSILLMESSTTPKRESNRNRSGPSGRHPTPTASRCNRTMRECLRARISKCTPTAQLGWQQSPQMQ